MKMEIFAEALKNKLRFATTSGSLSTEQLFDLPLESTRGASLRKLAESLQKEIGEQPTALLGFFLTPKKVNATLQLKFDVVKAIVINRVEESHAKTVKKAKDTKRQELDDLIAEKQRDETKSMTLAELQKMRDAL